MTLGDNYLWQWTQEQSSKASSDWAGETVEAAIKQSEQTELALLSSALLILNIYEKW